MIRTAILVAAALGALSMTTAAYAEDTIVGNWRTLEGDTAAVGHCGKGFCATLKTGKYAGRQIGQFTGGNGSYVGLLTDPSANKTYNGSGTVSGNALKLKGCVMKVFCQSQTWTRL